MNHRVLLGAAVLSVGTLLTGCGKSPESTVTSFYKAMAAGELAEAKTYLSSQLVTLLGDPKLTSVLAAETERIKGCEGFKSIDVKLDGQGEVRFGQTQVVYNGKCPEKTQAVKLVKQDGVWKIAPAK